eukprot:CAMPEP_0184697990 /NCGR_PEP_ID=MMETSP0313-20130426/4759_1 /TAXON_ID=2792 /ORGANISM="Porphyridium aerugineum, Strain SAG 1380-2" /LENGTH=220 /DNA_ID=CAMNT_0027156861 /DNA_START=46 /DNA_END=704 /DNA_ORIENTATION=-
MKPVALTLAIVVALGLATFAQAQIPTISPTVPTLKCDQVTTTISNACYQNIDILTPANPGTVWCENEATTCQILNATNRCERINCNKYWNTQAGWWRLGAVNTNCWVTCPNSGTLPASTSTCSSIQLSGTTILPVLRRLGLVTTGYTVLQNTANNANHQFPALQTSGNPISAEWRAAASNCVRNSGAQPNYQNICCCADSTDPAVIAEKCPTTEYVPITP